jgi:hypothetical protein
VLPDRIENLTTVNRDFLRGLNTQSNLVATNFDNDNCNVIVDDYALVFFARQYKHPIRSFMPIPLWNCESSPVGRQQWGLYAKPLSQFFRDTYQVVETTNPKSHSTGRTMPPADELSKALYNSQSLKIA